MSLRLPWPNPLAQSAWKAIVPNRTAVFPSQLRKSAFEPEPEMTDTKTDTKSVKLRYAALSKVYLNSSAKGPFWLVIAVQLGRVRPPALNLFNFHCFRAFRSIFSFFVQYRVAGLSDRRKKLGTSSRGLTARGLIGFVREIRTLAFKPENDARNDRSIDPTIPFTGSKPFA